MGRLVKDYSQMKIGHLQPLYIDETKPRGRGHNIYWICKCDCGNLVSMNSSNLRTYLRDGKNASCPNCRKTPLEDLTGQRFGKLVVIEHDDSYLATQENGWKHKWICLCDCGNKTSVFSGNLKRLHTTSCGCQNRSIGEANIEKILQENKINYKREYTFEDLSDKKKLRFDFAIFDKNDVLIKLIEFDGRQHVNEYLPWNSKETLGDRQKRDKMKDEYCLQNNIPLLRIPYSDRDKISLKLLGLEVV